jgi:hypothetical protein
MPEEQRPFISVIWEGIQAGAERPDDFLLDAEPGDQQDAAQRMHRCYVDSSDPKDRACPIEIARYATSTVSLLESLARGELDETCGETELRLKCGSLLGVISHLVADLWTPVHLGRSLQPADLPYRHRKDFHSVVEADLDKAAADMGGPLEHRPRRVPLDSAHFGRLGSQLYRRLYLRLPVVYGKNRWAEDTLRFAEACITGAACTTVDIWHTIAASSPVDEVLRRIGRGGA